MPLPGEEWISRKPLACAAALCLVVAALVVPFSIQLPKWIEWQLVLAVWWLFWWGTLAWLLHRGFRVDDDASCPRWSEGRTGPWLQGLGDFSNIGSCMVDDFCLGPVLAVLALILFGVAFFLLIEFLIPALAVLLFASLGGMFARAVNDMRGCEGRWGRSLLWGFLWATVYTGPIVAAVLWIGLVFGSSR